MSHSKRTQRLTTALLARDGNSCHVCGVPFDERHPPTLDHIQELRYGGRTHLDNLKLAHRGCNNLRSNSPERMDELRPHWIREIYGIVEVAYPYDRRPVQPLRIVDFKEAWFFGRYA